jgi:hypothetical protein
MKVAVAGHNDDYSTGMLEKLEQHIFSFFEKEGPSEMSFGIGRSTGRNALPLAFDAKIAFETETKLLAFITLDLDTFLGKHNLEDVPEPIRSRFEEEIQGVKDYYHRISDRFEELNLTPSSSIGYKRDEILFNEVDQVILVEGPGNNSSLKMSEAVLEDMSIKPQITRWKLEIE